MHIQGLNTLRPPNICAAVSGAGVVSGGRPSYNKDRCFTLLVVDDQNTDWSKYFRGKRLHGDYDIRVEQAEFKELSLIASADGGTTVSMAVFRNGTKVMRSFRPDFLLVRQNLRDAGEDNKNLLLGFKFGGVHSINTLHAIYNFQDKPWVFAHLLQLQRRLGKENFPLIEQTFYPNYREMWKSMCEAGQLRKRKRILPTSTLTLNHRLNVVFRALCRSGSVANMEKPRPPSVRTPEVVGAFSSGLKIAPKIYLETIPASWFITDDIPLGAEVFAYETILLRAQTNLS
uniref:Synapsin n=1 Tax=Timema shepardi TaxID=629360 RepID=A0A7R9B455_TIMSH|nr:unnamed protein product [Timema shepardi]